SPHWIQPAADTPTRCSATRHRHSWRRSTSPGSRSKMPWPTAKLPVTTTTGARQLAMQKVSNGRPWPAIRLGKRNFIMKESIGNFLLRRLEEVGIRHLFGVPGDYNLEFMQQLEDRGEQAWIGN